MSEIDLPSFIATKLSAQRLSILVFGPTPTAATDTTHSSHKTAKKRIEIRDHLRSKGHTAEFPEDLLQGSNTPPKGQVLLYEEALIAHNDLVVMIVESPGSNNELGYFAAKSSLAEKTQAFISSSYKGGLADDTCQALEKLGGVSHYFVYPEDIDQCHLLGKINDLVENLQRRKLYR